MFAFEKEEEEKKNERIEGAPCQQRKPSVEIQYSSREQGREQRWNYKARIKRNTKKEAVAGGRLNCYIEARSISRASVVWKPNELICQFIKVLERSGGKRWQAEALAASCLSRGISRLHWNPVAGLRGHRPYLSPNNQRQLRTSFPSDSYFFLFPKPSRRG